MSEEQRAECRAQGAFDDFLERMALELDSRDRSEQYREAFWEALKDRVCDFGLGGEY